MSLRSEALRSRGLTGCTKSEKTLTQQGQAWLSCWEHMHANTYQARMAVSGLRGWRCGAAKLGRVWPCTIALNANTARRPCHALWLMQLLIYIQ